MSAIWVITQKELRSYFDSPAAYVFMVMFLCLCGIYVVGNLFLENVASVRLFFEAAPLVMLFFVPAVTMRLISAEKEGGTFELLGTKPVRMGELVLGKFLASWFLVTCALLPTLVYAIVLSMLGPLDWGPVGGGYVGLFFLGGSFVAIGLFASSLSNNQIVSLITGCILISFLFFLDRILLFLPSALVSPVEYFSAGYHFSSLARGVLDSRDLVYYCSLIILFALLTTIVVAREYGQSLRDWRRFIPPAQMLRFGLVGIALVLANLVSMRMFFRVDLTAAEIYTLSSTTTSQLESLDDNLLVNAYISPDLPPPYHHHLRDIHDLLEEYHVYSHGKLQYRFIDPLGNAESEQEANEAGVGPIQLKVVRNDKVVKAKAYVGLSFSYADRLEPLPVVSSVERLEYDITNIIKHLTTPRKPVVGVLVGHGGTFPGPLSGFLDALGRRYETTTVTLSAWDPFTTDIAALLVVAPRQRFNEQEKFLIDQYIMRGGKVAFFVDAMVPDPLMQTARHLDLNLEDMFDKYGWSLGSDLLVDAQCATPEPYNARVDRGAKGANPFLPVVEQFDRRSPAVANAQPVVFSYASSIDTRLAGVRDIEAHVVASTSERSARMTGDSININRSRTTLLASFGEQAIPIAATFEGSFKSIFSGREVSSFLPAGSNGSKAAGKSVRTKIVVVGDGDFVQDGSLYGFQNISFALNLVDWMINSAGLGSIRPRDVAPPALDEIEEGSRRAVKYFSFFGPPVLVVIGGFIRMALNASRRERRKRKSREYWT